MTERPQPKEEELKPFPEPLWEKEHREMEEVWLGRVKKEDEKKEEKE